MVARSRLPWELFTGQDTAPSTLELRKRRVAKAKAAANGPADGPEDAVAADPGEAKLEDFEEPFSLFDWAEARSQLGARCLSFCKLGIAGCTAAYQVDFLLQECWDALPNRSS